MESAPTETCEHTTTHPTTNQGALQNRDLQRALVFSVCAGKAARSNPGSYRKETGVSPASLAICRQRSSWEGVGVPKAASGKARPSRRYLPSP